MSQELKSDGIFDTLPDAWAMSGTVREGGKVKVGFPPICGAKKFTK